MVLHSVGQLKKFLKDLDDNLLIGTCCVDLSGIFAEVSPNHDSLDNKQFKYLRFVYVEDSDC